MKRAKVTRSLLLSCLLTLTGNALALSDGAFRYDFIDLNRSKVRINGCSGTCPTTLVIPSEINGARVIAISDSAFFGRELISVVVIPDSVITIGNSAFRSNGLTSVIIPDSVITIGAQAFLENVLTRVVIGDSVTTIGIDAFYRNSIASVVLGDSVKTVGSGAFRGNALRSLIIPASVGHLPSVTTT